MIAWILLAGALLAQAPAPIPTPATGGAGASASSDASTAAVTTSAKPEAPPQDPPRVAYNKAVEALSAGDGAKAEAGFGDARDRAGADAELRFRAAYNLAAALSLRADGLEERKPEEAVQALRTAAAWLRDAIRQRPEESDPRANLEVVLRRIRVLSDRLAQGKDGVEARLERLVADESGLRDQVRGLAARTGAMGAGGEPLSQEEEFRAASVWQRQILGEAGTLAQMTAEEAGRIEGKPEAERDEKERIRAVQLRNLEQFLERARQRMADARSALGRLQPDLAHRRTDAAVRDLLRAQEQLKDPVQALQGALRDQADVTGGARALLQASSAALTTFTAEARLPAWLTGEYLAEREADVRERVQEVRMRLEAGVSSPEAASATARLQGGGGAPGGVSGADAAKGTGTKEDRDLARTIEAAREALPYLVRAEASLEATRAALAGSRPKEAVGPATEAAESLMRALERFSAFRALIELAHAEQTAVTALLTPPDPDQAERDATLAAVRSMPTEERARRVLEGVSRNAERLARLEGLFQEELVAVEERAAAAGTQAQAQGATPASSDDEAAKAERERYRLAEVERKAAAEAIARMADGLRATETPPLLELSRQAGTRIEALRRLFFSIVEHLEELAREEAHAREEAAGAATRTEPTERAQALGPVATGEARRAALARQLEEALRRQADEARATTGGQAGAEGGEKLGAAADEVKAAAAAMDGAAAEAATPAAEVEPILAGQKKAVEHLATAIALLKPPSPEDQQQQQDQQTQQGQGDQQKQDQAKEEQALSREQAERRLQAVRDREAERKKAERRKGEAAPSPVEKDW